MPTKKTKIKKTKPEQPADFEALEQESIKLEEQFEPVVEEEKSVKLEKSKVQVAKKGESVEPIKKQEASTEDEEKIKEDILSVLPKVEEVKEPEKFIPQTPEERKYAEEHQALPTAEDEPDEQVAEEEKQEIALRQEAEEEIKKEAQEGELDTMEQAVAIEKAQEQKPEELLQVEGILEKDVKEYVKKELEKLPGQKKFNAFIQAGDKIAIEVLELLQKKTVDEADVLQKIQDWLNLLPEVNNAYVYQMALTKTSQLLQLKNEWEGRVEEQ